MYIYLAINCILFIFVYYGISTKALNFHMHRKIFFWTSILGLIAVAIGAFGAHTLKDRLVPQEMESIKTGVQYHFYHVLALLATGLLYRSYRHPLISWAAIFFGVGILFFSFSLYFSAISTLSSAGVAGKEKWLNYFTPFGGVLFILGWGLLAIYFVKKRDKNFKKPSTPVA
jgi:uncharacterized membrane protein YgdD (TMEM256/DUF423 family)